MSLRPYVLEKRSIQWWARSSLESISEKPHTQWEARIDKLLSQNLASQHYETRKPLLDKILILMSEYLPQIPLVVEYLAAAADVRVGNFEPYSRWRTLLEH